MGCDYYIKTELIIEYLDIIGKISLISTNHSLEKGYVYKVSKL